MKKLLPDLPGVYGLTVFVGLTLFASPTVLKCGDTYWHIKVGKTILERGALLRYDIFSHTAYGRPWIAHEWLSELLMGTLYNISGLPGLTLTFLFVASTACYLMFLASTRMTNDWATATATALALPLIFSHLLIRPHIFTWLFGALTLYILLRQPRFLWLLPPVMALWANLHGGFVFGLFLQGAFWLGTLMDDWPEQSRFGWWHWLGNNWKISTILLLSVLASAINPYGFKLLWFPFEVSSPVFAREIGEWLPFDLQQNWYFRLWFILILVLASMHFKRTSWGWRIVILFLVYQALGHSRHVSIAALYTLPWVAMAIREAGSLILKRDSNGPQLPLSFWSGPVISSMIFISLFVASISQPAAWRQVVVPHFTPPPVFSSQLVEYLEKGYPGGKLLNEYSLGGYLLFALKDPPRVFIDGRADMYGEEIFSNYVKIAKLSPGFEPLLDKYGIDWVVFPNDHHVTRYLLLTDNWQRIYSDDQVSVLRKRPAADHLSVPTDTAGEPM